MNLKTVLKLFGVDLGKPLQAIVKLLPRLLGDKLEEEIEQYFSKRLSDERRFEVVDHLRLIALQIEKKNSVGAAAQTVKLLKGIKL